MNNSFSDIKTILDEINFYEKKGYYKIADSLTRQFTKISWNFDMGKYNDPYAKSLDSVLAVSKITTMLKQVPECASLLMSFNQTKSQSWSDPRDCMLKLQAENDKLPPAQQRSLEDLQKECYDSVINNVDSAIFGQNPDYEKCREGLAKIGMTPQFDQAMAGIGAQLPPSPQQPKTVAPAQTV